MTTADPRTSATAGAVLFVHALDVMATFYEAVFRAVRVEQTESYIALDIDGFQLLLHAIPSHIAETLAPSTAPVRRADAALKLSLPVASLHETRARVHGNDGVMDAEDRSWEWHGRRYCDVIDPEGNVVQCHAVVATNSTGA